MATPDPENLMREYAEVGNNFRTLTDIRFKLLSFLPVVSGAAVALAAYKGDVSPAPTLGLALFGLASAIGLWTYNKRNDQLYDELVGRATFIERSVGLLDGQFANRPAAWLTLRVLGSMWKISHREGVGLIYAASIALWLSLLFSTLGELIHRMHVIHRPAQVTLDSAQTIGILALLLSILVTVWLSRTISRQEKRIDKDMRTAAAEAYRIALDAGPALAFERNHDLLVAKCAKVNPSLEPEKILARSIYHRSTDLGRGQFYLPSEPPSARAAHLIALLTDLPARWIMDSGEDRRGARASDAHKP